MGSYAINWRALQIPCAIGGPGAETPVSQQSNNGSGDRLQLDTGQMTHEHIASHRRGFPFRGAAFIFRRLIRPIAYGEYCKSRNVSGCSQLRYAVTKLPSRREASGRDARTRKHRVY